MVVQFKNSQKLQSFQIIPKNYENIQKFPINPNNYKCLIASFQSSMYTSPFDAFCGNTEYSIWSFYVENQHFLKTVPRNYVLFFMQTGRLWNLSNVHVLRCLVQWYTVYTSSKKSSVTVGSDPNDLSIINSKCLLKVLVIS